MSQSIQNEKDIDWINTARAMSIFLVVSMHASLYLPIMDWDQRDDVIAVWDVLNKVFHPARMPLFFLISGLLTQSSISNDSLQTRLKWFWRPWYLYLLWAALLMVMMPHDPTVGPVPRSLEGYAIWVILAVSPAWYFFGLAIFYALARATANWPALVVLILGLSLAIFGEVYGDHLPGRLHQLFRCAVFFLVGCRFRNFIVNFPVLRMKTLIGAAFIYPIAISLNGVVPFPKIALEFSSIITMLYISVIVSKCRINTIMRLVGRNTLAVYVFHFSIVSYASYAISYIVKDSQKDIFLIMSFYPILVALISIPLSLWLHEACKKVRARWLFDLPSFSLPLGKQWGRS